MHYRILVKIRADRLSDAKDDARSILEESVAENNHAGWDYLSDDNTLVVNQRLLSKEKKYKTFQGLEQSWKAATLRNYRHHKAALKDIFFNILIRKHAYGKKALSYLRYRNEYGDLEPKTKKLVLEATKADRKSRFPSTRLEDIAEAVSELLDPSLDSMTGFHVRRLQELRDCMDFPTETSYTLQCLDNHFADLGGKGRQTYYFIFDRHS